MDKSSFIIKFLFAILSLLWFAGCATKKGDVWDGVVENYVSMTSKYKEEAENGSPDFQTALSSFDAGDYPSAQRLFARFVQYNPVDPNVPLAIFLEGECFYKLGVFLQAISYYDKILDQYPDHERYLPSMQRKADSLHQIGQKSKAEELNRRLASLKPSSPPATPTIDARESPLPPSKTVSASPAKLAATTDRSAIPAARLPRNRKFALVVGISKYKENSLGLTDLLYADEDAKGFYDALVRLGWSEGNIRTLINEDATRRNVVIALDSWLTKAGPDDTIVLFWAGHGYPDPEDPQKVYFACYDSDLRIPATGFRMAHVRQSLEEKKAKNVLVFADTCHAGKLITRGIQTTSLSSRVKEIRERDAIPNGWIFMVAAEADRKAIEHTSWTNGAFTHCLLEGLMGGADGFESSGQKDGVITMGELRSFLYSKMPEMTQQVLGVAKIPTIATNSGNPGIWNLVLEDQ